MRPQAIVVKIYLDDDEDDNNNHDDGPRVTPAFCKIYIQ